MPHDRGRAYQPFAGAVEVAIAAGRLPLAARGWGKTVLLEELALVLGLARNALRNLYYRQDARLDLLLDSYVATSHSHVIAGLEELGFHTFSPLVWKRPAEQLRASRQALERTVILLQAAERSLRESLAPPVGLRRMVGAVAAEMMACALTFFEGQRRWRLLLEGEHIFLSAMAPLALERDIEPADAALFARFWENRATRCGLEWSNVWDDPSLPPPIGMDVVRRAIAELEEAATWMRRHGGRPVAEDERLRQLLADKAKWLAKAGRFGTARVELEKLSDFEGPGARSDGLLVRALEQIAGNQLEAAARTSGELAELAADDADESALAPVTAAIMVHNIELLRERRPALPERIGHFLETSPVTASELVNLPRYRIRLESLEYRVAATAF